MNTTEIVRQLQTMPPVLPEPPDRFDQVRHRVVRRRLAVRRRRAVFASAAAVAAFAAGPALLSQLTDDPSKDRALDPTPSATSSVPPSPPSALGSAQGSTCGSPSKELLDWSADAIPTGPGPVTGSALIFAATSPTGDWYVLATERAYIHDDGTLAGGAGRTLALVNAADFEAGDPHLINIGRNLKNGGVSPDWHRVNWTGATLRAGEKAAAAALLCLDHG